MDTLETKKAFEIAKAAEGDGKALVCCVGSKEMEAIKPRLDEMIAELKGERMSAFMATALAEGDGKALVCCVGTKTK